MERILLLQLESEMDGHLMSKGDEDWVKKCMEYRVQGRRPVGRLRKIWLDSVEVDMAELEIDKEDVHDRS